MLHFGKLSFMKIKKQEKTYEIPRYVKINNFSFVTWKYIPFPRTSLKILLSFFGDFFLKKHFVRLTGRRSSCVSLNY